MKRYRFLLGTDKDPLPKGPWNVADETFNGDNWVSMPVKRGHIIVGSNKSKSACVAICQLREMAETLWEHEADEGAHWGNEISDEDGGKRNVIRPRFYMPTRGLLILIAAGLVEVTEDGK